MLLELTVKWNLTTQINAYDMEGNQISKQNRYPCQVNTIFHLPFEVEKK